MVMRLIVNETIGGSTPPPGAREDKMNKDKIELDERLLRAKRDVEVAKKAARDSEKRLREKYPEYFEEKEKGK